MSDRNIAYLQNENMSDLRGSLRYHYRGNQQDWMLTRDAVHGELLKALRAIDVMRGVAVAALKHSPPRTQAESLQRQREIEKQRERSEHIADELSKRRITETNTTRSGNQFLYQNDEGSNNNHSKNLQRTGSNQQPKENSPSPKNNASERSGSRSQPNQNPHVSYGQNMIHQQSPPLPSVGSTVPRNAFPTAHHNNQSTSPPASTNKNSNTSQKSLACLPPRISISPPQQDQQQQQQQQKQGEKSTSPNQTSFLSQSHKQQHQLHLQHISTARTTSQDALMDVDPQLAFEVIAVSKGQLGEALHLLRGDPIDFGDDSDASGNPPMKVIERSPPRTFYRHNDPDAKNRNQNNSSNNINNFSSVSRK